MRPLDTSEKAHAFYFQRLSQMPPEETLRIGAGLWGAGHSLQRAGILLQMPGASEAEVLFEMAVRRFGRTLAEKAYRKV